MFLAHSFRLRDPWQCEAGADGTIRWTRVFHRPTGLEADDQLWLVVAGLPDDAAVTVNGSRPPRDSDGAHQYNVTPLLADANRVELTLPAAPGEAAAPSTFPYDARLGVVART